MNKYNLKIIVMLLLLAITSIFSIVIGYTKGISINTILNLISNYNMQNNEQLILITQRIPRMLNAIVVGSSLAIAGLLSQTLTRNKLASPNILAVNSSISFMILISLVVFSNNNYTFIFAFIGGSLGLGLTLYLTAKVSKGLNTVTMAIIGMSLSMLFTSLIQMIIYFNPTLSEEISFWTMGTLEGKTLETLMYYLPLYIFLIVVVFILSKRFEMLTLGEQKAMMLGVNVKLLKLIIMVIIVLFTIISVSIGGPIAMLGLFVPHVGRYLSAGKYVYTIIYSLLLGMIFLQLFDILTRVVAYPSEVPVGLISSFFGAIFFIYLATKGNIDE